MIVVDQKQWIFWLALVSFESWSQDTKSHWIQPKDSIFVELTSSRQRSLAAIRFKVEAVLLGKANVIVLAGVAWSTDHGVGPVRVECMLE